MLSQNKEKSIRLDLSLKIRPLLGDVPQVFQALLKTQPITSSLQPTAYCLCLPDFSLWSAVRTRDALDHAFSLICLPLLVAHHVLVLVLIYFVSGIIPCPLGDWRGLPLLGCAVCSHNWMHGQAIVLHLACYEILFQFLSLPLHSLNPFSGGTRFHSFLCSLHQGQCLP